MGVLNILIFKVGSVSGRNEKFPLNENQVNSAIIQEHEEIKR